MAGAPPRAPPAAAGWRPARVWGYSRDVSAKPAEARFLLIGPPRLDGGGQTAALWRRAVARRELSEAAAVVILGDLSAHGAAPELDALRLPTNVRATWVPGPMDVPGHGRAAPRVEALAGLVPPRVVPLGDGRTTLVVLDSVRLRGGRDALGAAQLAALEDLLAARPQDARTVLVLAHDPRGPRKPPSGETLQKADQKALAALLARHPVALVVHGQSDALVRGKLGRIPTLAPPPLAGCRLTGLRVLLQVSFPDDGPGCVIERIHHARPEARTELQETFAAADAAGAWTALAEKIVAADDTFAAIAEAMAERDARFEALGETSARLDGALAALLRRAQGDDET